jgi:quinol-cytochrome oxidoreductase complex cytochrome b subunit
MTGPRNRRRSEESASQDSERGNIAGRFWRSVFRGPLRPRDDTDRKRIVLTHLVLHNRPIRVPEANIRYTHTWGLGGSSSVLFSLLVATGMLLIFVYEPSPDAAYLSILKLRDNVFFGKFIRNIHYWSANFLIVVAVLHLLRVYFTAAYHGPRRFNWVIGLALLFCVLASNFTGYLLPWNQLSYWAITIVTGMIGYVPLFGETLQNVVRGGREIGAPTLVDYYAAHTTVLPALIIAIMAFHFWRVRKAGGVVIPRAPEDPPAGAGCASPDDSSGDKPATVLALPHLLFRELAAGLALVAFIMVLALLFDAPLGDPANPGMSPNPAKAPWYFLGFQELLLHFDPVFAIVVIPMAAAIGLLILPYIRYRTDSSGVFLMSRIGRRMARDAAIAAAVATPVLIVADEFVIDFAGWIPALPPVVANGVIPAAIAAGLYALVRSRLKKKYAASNDEMIQTTFILFAAVFAILTLTGIFFRGPGMALVWPWNR